MSRPIWFLGWLGVAVWSIVCWATYGLFDVVGRLMMRNADAVSSDPYVVENLWRVLNVLHSLSTWAVAVVWAIVSLLILAVPWVIDRMLGGAAVATVRRAGPLPGTPPASRPLGRDDGVIDLAPDQYTVRPTGAARTGPVPRMDGRR